ncbi:hypothetical protein GcM3_089016, partial [Golovinomyces cichoracearum]
MCTFSPSRDPHSGDELAPAWPGKSKVVAGGWGLPVDGQMPLLAPRSTVDTPALSFYISGQLASDRAHDIVARELGLELAGPKRWRTCSMAGCSRKCFMWAREEVQRVDIMAKAPVGVRCRPDTLGRSMDVPPVRMDAEGSSAAKRAPLNATDPSAKRGIAGSRTSGWRYLIRYTGSRWLRSINSWTRVGHPLHRSSCLIRTEFFRLIPGGPRVTPPPAVADRLVAWSIVDGPSGAGDPRSPSGGGP